MSSWFRKQRAERQAPQDPASGGAADGGVAAGGVADDGVADKEDAPTGQIAAVRLNSIVAEVDGAAGGVGEGTDAAGTDDSPGTSNTDVEPVPVLAPTGRDDLDRALADRQTLIQLCLYALDRARSGGVVERIEQGLAGIGVIALRPEGQRFDPSLHEAGGAVPTDDPALEGVVAETEIVGFADRERLLRAPVVTVYTRR